MKTILKQEEIQAIKEFVGIILDSYDDRAKVVLTNYRSISKCLAYIGILTEYGEFDSDKISEYADIFALYGITNEYHLFYYKGKPVYI